MKDTESVLDRSLKRHLHKQRKGSAKNVMAERINPVLLAEVYNLCHQDFKINTDWEATRFARERI